MKILVLPSSACQPKPIVRSTLFVYPNILWLIISW